MLPVVILAGGLATRLRPITESMPKALISIAGKPFIYHQLNYLYSQGVRKVILCIGYLGEMIQSLIGDGSNLGMEVIYSFDGEKLLGTGGAIKKALPYLGNFFFVLYGDSFLPVQMLPIENAFLNSKKLGLMTVLKNSNRWDSSNVFFQNKMLVEYNKTNPSLSMSYIDYGLGVLNASVFEDYSLDQPFDLAEVYNHLSLQNQLEGYEVFDRFYEIGSLSGIRDTEEFLLSFGKNT
jgi:MurNAc alpha-1-phosphate uridylyltransferase